MTDTGRQGNADRRRCPTPIMSRYALLGGRRRHVRRDEDKKKHLFVDLYSKRLLIAVIALLLLSCLDAYMTLVLIEKGVVVEANPLMAFVMQFGVMTFTVTKFVITSVALIILCLFKNVKITRIGFPIVINLYLGLVLYEFYIYFV